MIKIGRWEFGKSQEANPQDSRNESYDNPPVNIPEKENTEGEINQETPEEEKAELTE